MKQDTCLAMSQQNVEAVRRQHEHFSRTGEVLSEIYEPEAEWMAAREDPDAATHRGLEAIRRYFAHWAGMFESIDLRAEELLDAGDRVFAWIRFAGKGAASGAPVEMEQAQIWTFRDGKVVRVEEYFDRTEALDVAGLSDEAMSQEKVELVKAVYSHTSPVSSPATAVIHLEVEWGSDTITGRVYDEQGNQQPFFGWLALMSALEGLVGDRPAQRRNGCEE